MSHTSNRPGTPSDRTGRDEADFGEKGPATVDENAGKSEQEKLEDAVEDLKTDAD